MKDLRISSGTSWESEIGYSSIVRRGSYISVSGTTAMRGDQLVGGGSAGEQAAFIFEKIIRYLSEVDASLEDVVRTRMHIADARYAESVTGQYASVFRDIRPATSLIIVSGFIDPRLLVEIEVDAVVAE